MTALEAIVDAILDGSPYALGAFGWVAWWCERRINRETNEKLIELAGAQIKATIKHESVLSANTRLMERMIEK